ncbi:MAG: 23S rRNA (pseudouridine(1915)-N(3))-methyltransferase RlmH [Neisseriaceae bacterium]
MKLQILAVSNKMPTWVSAACEEYLKRFKREYTVKLKEIKPEKRKASYTTEQILAREEESIRQSIEPGSYLVVLDEKGVGLNTLGWVDLLRRWQAQSESPCFVIGSSDGVSPLLKKESALTLQLSQLTLPHGLARIILLEQLYRAISIIQNHPYHRG